MSETRLRANQFPRVLSRNDSQEFEIIKWYTSVISDQANEQQLQVLARQKKYAGLLVLSAFYIRQGDFIQAQQQLDLAKKINAEHNLVSLLQADIFLGQNKVAQAYQAIINKQRTMPENRALAYKLAEIYIRQNQPKDAEKIVNGFIAKNYRDVSGWLLLQQAANLDKDNPMRTVNVLRNRAEAQYWAGDEENAIKSLLHAQRLAKGNNAMTAKVDSRLKTMQTERKMKI